MSEQVDFDLDDVDNALEELADVTVEGGVDAEVDSQGECQSCKV